VNNIGSELENYQKYDKKPLMCWRDGWNKLRSLLKKLVALNPLQSGHSVVSLKYACVSNIESNLVNHSSDLQRIFDRAWSNRL
jgi:hypothetical protein